MPHFKKSLGLIDSVSLVTGSMIGSGIFIVSADIARNLGAPGWLLVVWLITGLMTVFAALSYGELASLFPKAGGQYIYLREAYNPLAGFLYGWTLFTVIQTGTIAAVAMAFAKYAGVLLPWFSETNTLFRLGFIQFTSVHLLAIGMIVLLTANNLRGVEQAKWVQTSFTVIKVLLLIGFIFLCLFVAKDPRAVALNQGWYWHAANTQGETLSGWALLAAIGISMVGSLFSADAWNNLTFAGDEVKNPQRNIPLGLVIGVTLTIVLFVLANIAYMNALPLRGQAGAPDVFGRGMQFATSDRLGSAAIEGLFGASASVVMAAFIVISTFGCNNGLILSGARVYFAMANDRLFFGKAARLNRRGVPAFGLKLQAAWASLLCLSGTYSNLLDYVVFAVLIFYVLTIIGLFRLRVKMPDAPRKYKAFGYPLVPILYCLMALVIMVILLLYKPAFTWPGLIIVLAGIPVYFLVRRYSKINL